MELWQYTQLGKSKMFKKVFMLFKIGRKLSTSGAISSIYEIYNPPVIIKILFFIIGFDLGSIKIITDHLQGLSYAMLYKRWEQHLLN